MTFVGEGTVGSPQETSKINNDWKEIKRNCERNVSGRRKYKRGRGERKKRYVAVSEKRALKDEGRKYYFC